MSPIGAELERLSRQVADLSNALGQRVDVAALGVSDRAGELALGPAGEAVSPNGACRLFRATDGWMALNLAREEDHDLVPAWLETDALDEPWALIAAEAPRRAVADLIARAAMMGLPAALVGEASPGALGPDVQTPRRRSISPPPASLRVVDLSALWAGPMCGAILASMGAEVTKIESTRRPDPTRISTPGFDARLNGAKTRLSIDLATSEGQAELGALVMGADLVITSARRRGLAGIGLNPERMLAARPGLIWVAITGHGWPTVDVAPERVAFGDDAAAAGGLVGWTAEGEPRFLGDALSDPLTGITAAAGALAALCAGRGGLVDAAMAPIAARAAAGRR